MVLPTQLRLDVFQPEKGVKPYKNDDMIDAFIAANGGDHRAAMRELLLDADFLRDQLAIAHRLMSNGYSRGWKPKYERV